MVAASSVTSRSKEAPASEASSDQASTALSNAASLGA
jgi:hypothetical protein